MLHLWQNVFRVCLFTWLAPRGLRSTLLLSLERMASLAARALVGVESDMCHQNKPPSLGSPALPWLCDLERGVSWNHVRWQLVPL